MATGQNQAPKPSAMAPFLTVLAVAGAVTLIYLYLPAGKAGGGLQHTTKTTLAMLIVFATALLYNILSARSGRQLFIRRIPGLAAIDEAMGRATEMGRPIMFNYGILGLGVEVLQAMTVLSHVTRRAARFGCKMIVPVVDPQVMAVTEGVLREAYGAEGKENLFHSDDIRFLSGEQFAYAAGCMGIMNRERVAANFMIGYFYAESLLLAETGQVIGAIQIAGVPDPQQVPFFVVTCDYVILGDEYYAASAYLSREPTLLGSLVGQDMGKAMMILIVVVFTAIAAFQASPWAKNLLALVRQQLGG
jgi:hypothetical protein